MRILATAVGALLTAAAATASAQVVYERTYTYDPYVARVDPFEGRRECWNPRAGHFEAVRPGEVQSDLDFGRCRIIGQPYYGGARVLRTADECWNPRQRHYERVRPGEIQNDLDFGRCRMVNDERYSYSGPAYVAPPWNR